MAPVGFMYDAAVLAEEDFQEENNTASEILTRKLDANPLFVAGAQYDEFQLNPNNLEFAKANFGLEDQYMDLVNAGYDGARFSVVYHTDEEGMHVDAYRVAAAAGKDAVFTAYDVKDPAFHPAMAYRTEVITERGEGKFFGSLIGLKKLPVPDDADPGLKEYLKGNGFNLKETVEFEEFGFNEDFKSFFGIPDDLSLEMYQMDEKSFMDKFKVFYRLFKEDPEYAVLKVGDLMGNVGAAMLLGVITPKLWEQGAAYGIASTITSIGNIGSPALGIIGESFLGSVVDNAVNSEKPMEELKKVNLYVAGLGTVTGASYFGLHPDILKHLGENPGYAFIGIYGAATVASAISGTMSGKANLAIHDQIINKKEHEHDDYSENFWQIMGVESSIGSGVYLGTYSGTVAATKAWPVSSVPVAAAGAALWVGSNFLFSLYHEKPEVKTTIEGTAFIHDGDSYIFDSGWEVSFKGSQGKIVKEDDNHYAVAFNEGDLYIKHNGPEEEAVDLTHKRRIKDFIPVLKSIKAMGEKEIWKLDDGKDKVEVSRFGKNGYHLEEVSPNEWVVTNKTDELETFWDDE
jgi:hypothetical protein